MIKLIIFDWDDVFTLGSKEGYFKCYHETLSDLGVRLEPEDEKQRIMSRWSEPHQEKFKKLLKERPKLIPEASKIYEKKLFGGIFSSCLNFVQGSNELLEKLSKKYSLAVATGAHRKILEEVFEKNNVPQVFSKIMHAYEIEDPSLHKPHPYVLNTIMNNLGFKAKETIFVGDARSDFQTAVAAGVIPVIVLTGHLTREEAEKMGAKFIIKNVLDVESVISEINSGVA